MFVSCFGHSQLIFEPHCVPPSQEPKGAYSKLDPEKPLEFEEEPEEDLYPDIDDLEPTDLVDFAYQIATGMVRTSVTAAM